MKQLNKPRSIAYHLYPGILITLGFIVLGPIAIRNGYPPQFGMLIAIIFMALPVLGLHLLKAKKEEGVQKISELIGLKNRIHPVRLFLYAIGLVILAFLLWGVTQPLDIYISKRIFSWLPPWFTVQNFNGYNHDKIRTTLLLNIFLNGIIAPFAEKVYFRGYLLPRVNTWGKSSFAVNTVLFSIYHFWQPYVYLTLILALLPMNYLVWKTNDIRLGILTHSLLNITGAILTLAMLKV
jgi:membrane protease YdiL (CAAX protease family)